MLKALRRFTQLLRVHIYVPGCCKYIRMTNGLQPLVELCFTQLLRVHIYVPGCCKYIRMTNGLQPLVELCMDGCFADFPDIDHYPCC